MPSKFNNYFFRLLSSAIVPLIINGSLQSQESNFKKRLPDHINIQYAGGIGFISIGTGYSNKTEKLEGDLFYGYLPKSIGGVRIHSLSAKLIWIPFHLSPKNKHRVDPLMTGLLVNYNFGKQFFGFDPENYSYKYYSFPTAINTAIFIGSRVGFKNPKNLAFYYEILTFDRELLSLLTNPKSLDLTDILNVSFGARINIR